MGLLLGTEKGLPFYVIGLYCLASSVTLASTFHYLYPSYVLVLTLFFLAGLAYGLNPPEADWPWRTTSTRNCLYLAGLVYLSFFSFQVLQGFIGGQDSRCAYLPMSRLLSQDPELPTSLYYDKLPHFTVYAGYPPLLTGLGALFFRLFGHAEGEVAALVPSLFFIGFLVTICKWSEACSGRSRNPDPGSATSPPQADSRAGLSGEGESRCNTHVALTAVLLLLSPFFIERASWFGYEAPLVFGATWLMYMLWRFSVEKQDQFLYYAMLGSSLCLLSKYTGILFTGLLIVYILEDRRFHRKTWVMFLLLHLPCLVWYGRNIYYFGNPIPPFLGFLTTDPLIKSWWHGFWLLEHKESHLEWGFRLFNLLLIPVLLPLLIAWIVLFPLSARMRAERSFKRFYILFGAFALMWLAYNPDMRYLMPFYGAALIQVGGFLGNVLSLPRGKEGPSIGVLRYLLSPITLISLTIVVIILQAVYVKRVFPDYITPNLQAIAFLQKEEKAAPGTRVFTDTDHLMTWQADFTVFVPPTPKFAPEFLEARRTGDFYKLLSSYRIQYVINHPWKSPWEESVFSRIEGDGKHFRQIYSDKETIIWKVLYSGD